MLRVATRDRHACLCGRSSRTPDQPRKTFDEETLAEPGGQHCRARLAAAHRGAAKRPGWAISSWPVSAAGVPPDGGLTEVPVVVKDVTDEQAMELALMENLQREDLDPVEEAEGIRELMTRCDLTQEQAAKRLGKSRSAWPTACVC